MEAAQILDRVVARFIGTKHERDIKKLMPVIAAINAREAEVQPLAGCPRLRFSTWGFGFSQSRPLLAGGSSPFSNFYFLFSGFGCRGTVSRIFL